MNNCRYVREHVLTKLVDNFTSQGYNIGADLKKASCITSFPRSLYKMSSFQSFEYIFVYIDLINRARGPYSKLWTEFFSSPYGPSALRARAIRRRKKRGSITYGTDQANEVNKIFIIWL